MNVLSARMHDTLPLTFGRLAEALAQADIPSRVYSEDSLGVVSDDFVANNIGLSAAYHSPHHVDAKDTGPTVAFAIKCPPRASTRVRGARRVRAHTPRSARACIPSEGPYQSRSRASVYLAE